MFSKFADFFIKNSKLTVVLIIITLLSWIWSYIIIPKQYNPTIIVPAFNVLIKAPSLSSDETKRLITNELENKLMEIDWVDEVFWVSADNYVWVMVKFKVWEDSEKAKIKLYQKMYQNLDLKPIWVEDPIIKTINPDELPQITYAIYYNDKNSIWIQDQAIYLRQIANLIKNKLKVIENVTTLDIVWGIKKNIVINLDLEKIESKNTDIMQVYNVLNKNNLSLPNWNFNLKNWERVFLETSWKINDIENLKKLIISNINWKIISSIFDFISFVINTQFVQTCFQIQSKTALFHKLNLVEKFV